MSKKVKKVGPSDSNQTLANKGKALVADVSTALAAGAPLSVKQRKEVMIRTIRITPAFVSAAASAYAENAAVLGGDLDPDAALAAQDFVVQMTPVATDLRTLTQAVEDRVHEHKATAAEFAQTVYDRMKGMQSMPQGKALASRLTQLQGLSVKPKRKSKATDAAATPEEATATTAAPPAAETPAK